MHKCLQQCNALTVLHTMQYFVICSALMYVMSCTSNYCSVLITFVPPIMQGVCVAYDVVVHMKIDLYKRTAVSTIHLC